MEKKPLRVLLIEDDEDDYVMVRDLLSEARPAGCDLAWVTDYDAGLEAICGRRHDVCLLDYRLGDKNGLDLLRELAVKGCELPVILLTGQGGSQVDLEALRRGAADYLVKGQISAELLERSIRYSMERKHGEKELKQYRDHLEELVKERTKQLEGLNESLQDEIARRGRTEEAMRESEERYRVLVDSALDLIFTVSSDGVLASLNPAFEIITGWSHLDWIGKHFGPLIHPDDLPSMTTRLGRLLRGEPLPPVEFRILSKSNDYRILEFKSLPLIKEGEVMAVMGTARDVTDRRQAEKKIAEQNEFLNNVLESLTHPFYVLDASDYTIKMANSAAAPGGLPPNSTCYALAHRQTGPCGGFPHIRPLETVKRTKQPLTTEHIHFDAHGNPRHVEVHAHPILDSGGNVVQIIEYTLDITERKEMDEALRKAHDELESRVEQRTADLARANEALRAQIAERKKIEEALRLDDFRLESLLELSQMSEASLKEIADFVLEQQVRLTESKVGALAFLNEDETVLTVHAWSKLPGEQCPAKDKPIHLPIENAGCWADAVRERSPIIINGQAAAGLYNTRCPECRVELSRVMSLPVLDGNRIVCIALVGNKEVDYDASDERQLTLLLDGMWKLIRRERSEKALREAESMAAMGRALSTVAHDIKTPLIAIGGFTRLVRKHMKEGHPDRDKLDIVLKETQRLENMVEDMLNFARPLELYRSQEDVNRVIDESLALVESVALQGRVTIESRLSRDLPLVLIDAMRMKQAIINLVVNAVQASPEGETVRVATHQRKGRLLIDITDVGCGVPLDKREEIFHPFISTKKEGTGLGLPIVKKIVEAHAGHVEILDNPEKGVTFRVVIPGMEDQ